MAKPEKNRQSKKATPKKATVKEITTRATLKANGAIGCCKILIPGDEPKFHSGSTEFRCEQIANDIGGATYNFDEGVDCPQ